MGTFMTKELLCVLMFAVSFILTFASTPFVKIIAEKIGAIDVPKDNRRMHKEPIPRMGGLAMFYGFIASVLVFVDLDKPLIGMIIGATIIVALGIVDDRKALKAKPKFLIQIIAAVIAVMMGVTIQYVKLPIIGTVHFSAPWSHILAVLWIVAITNAVNLIDGLDGLAAGVSAISSLSLFLIALIIPNSAQMAVICAGLVGCCVGFLPFNSNPAKIFMGDTGALFLGFSLACISILGAYKSYALISFVAPFLVLGLPIFDTAFAILRRLINHKPIMSADRGHLHHRLIDMGFSPKQTVIILYCISSLLGLSAVVTAIKGLWNGFTLAIAILPIFAASLIFAYKHKKENKDDEQ